MRPTIVANRGYDAGHIITRHGEYHPPVYVFLGAREPGVHGACQNVS